MDKNVFEILQERGYIEQFTSPDIKDYLNNNKVNFYIGFDATADSLTVGHFLTIMVIHYLQKFGHKPIILFGGGTTLIGDPSGKSSIRKLLSIDDINNNIEKFTKQIKSLNLIDSENITIVNNYKWLSKIDYIKFIKDIGIHFSVNKMISSECYKRRMKTGLTFFEFNYMLLQAYDFLNLYKDQNCTMQIGGNDQWSNIIAGVELIRKKENKKVYGLTLKLLTNSNGVKMGKTEKGAIWLDKHKTSPFEFYQYWRNIEDDKVEECLKLLTFVDIKEIKTLSQLKASKVNLAKDRLAYEITKIVHGEKEADNARNASLNLFNVGSLNDNNIPTTEYSLKDINKGLDILTLLIDTKLVKSKSEGRRLIEQGGISVNKKQVDDIFAKFTIKDFNNDILLIKKGKKVYHQIKRI